MTAINNLADLVTASLTTGGTGGTVFNPTSDAVQKLVGGVDIADVEDYVIDLAKSGKSATGTDFSKTFFFDLPSGILDNTGTAGFIVKVNSKEWVPVNTAYLVKTDSANPQLEVIVLHETHEGTGGGVPA